MPNKPKPTLVSRLCTPLAITLAYVAGSALWITLSDRALARLLPDVAALAAAGTIKGYLFCVFTGALLYGLLKTWDASRRAASAAQHRLLQAAAVFDTTREGIVVTDAAGEIQMVNRGFSAITGYAEHEVLGKAPSLLSSGRHGTAFFEEMWDSLAATGYWRGEIWNRRKDGQVYPEYLSISALRDESGQIVSYVGVYADVSDVRDAEEKLEFVAHHDPLTRLPNRRLLTAHLDHLLSAAQREHAQFAVLQLDLDRFKDINESYGHALGDELLVQVAATLRDCVRQCDTVARPGGDEFLVVLEKVAHAEDAARVAGEIIERLGHEWPLSNGARVRTGVSIGISLYPQHGGSVDELLQHADAAMYLAKTEGRNCYRYFSEHLTRSARERIELETELHQAIPRGELCVHFQPQVDIATGAITGAEALVRWDHPERGMIAPCSFIPIAETSNLISEIGHWVLRETCRQGRIWIDGGMPALTLAVNVSPRQFNGAGFTARVRQVLEETGFPAHCLELELTESALMERGERALANLAGLRELGVRLAIDDFGTGYSSLAYLKNFPLDVLKIDRSFVQDIPQHADDMAIASAIIDMGHTLGFRVLAEGVETSDQLEFLARQGCDTYQGFYKGKAVAATEFERMYADGALRNRG